MSSSRKGTKRTTEAELRAVIDHELRDACSLEVRRAFANKAVGHLRLLRSHLRETSPEVARRKLIRARTATRHLYMSLSFGDLTWKYLENAMAARGIDRQETTALLDCVRFIYAVIGDAYEEASGQRPGMERTAIKNFAVGRLALDFHKCTGTAPTSTPSARGGIFDQIAQTFMRAATGEGLRRERLLHALKEYRDLYNFKPDWAAIFGQCHACRDAPQPPNAIRVP